MGKGNKVLTPHTSLPASAQAQGHQGNNSALALCLGVRLCRIEPV